ncbi:hypothetical protein AKJ37_03170 [candidate division MSBL1 archaeon SCGC-AAA259I09]|uniref:Uncharacterized protein n=1 Tax=candidate division MSBL1 archaeon SCGC-AAA259I09 TaxID=1698267 RepID=A0A133UT87_9EURY|nr:hypothetical protein AKJ37_03170 [candidate division MSBL1 archaeon SCGC-AAA259I09]
MKVEEGEFHYLKTDSEEFVLKGKEESIEKLKEIADDGKPDPGETGVFRVSPSDEEWSIEQVPWSEIALELL